MRFRTVVQRAKTLLRIVLGRDVFVRRTIRCEFDRFGSEFGGWEVSTAGIDSDAIVYSFGVGEDASFDIALINRFGLSVHAFDPTPKSIEWVSGQALPEQFVLHEYGIAGHDGTVTFYPPENPEHVSHTMLDRPSTQAGAIAVPVKRLTTIMLELGHDHIDLLKMDIEGAEYEVIADLEATEARPGQILVEFHHRFPGVGVEKTKEALRTLRSMGYELFSISATNEEFSFIHRPA